MKIPTKRTNTKRNFLALGTMAAVVGLTPVATTFAHGGYDGNERDDSTKHWSSDNRWRSHSHHDWYSQSWWHIPSSEDFTERHEKKLALYEKVIDKYDLEVENGAELRATLETDAAEASAALTAYEELKAEVKASDEEPTDEQKVQLKEATLNALSALYDYKESSKAYASAIIDAFKAKWDDEAKTEKLERQL